MMAGICIRFVVCIINISIKQKSGKVTIPRHGGDLNINTANSIFKQAGLK